MGDGNQAVFVCYVVAGRNVRGVTIVRLRDSNLVWQEVDGEVIILDSKTSKYFRLNGTGAILWSMLETGAARADMIKRLLDTFDVEREVAAADVDAFLDALRTRRLLENDS